MVLHCGHVAFVVADVLAAVDGMSTDALDTVGERGPHALPSRAISIDDAAAAAAVAVVVAVVAIIGAVVVVVVVVVCSRAKQFAK